MDAPEPVEPVEPAREDWALVDYSTINPSPQSSFSVKTKTVTATLTNTVYQDPTTLTRTLRPAVITQTRVKTQTKTETHIYTESHIQNSIVTKIINSAVTATETKTIYPTPTTFIAAIRPTTTRDSFVFLTPLPTLPPRPPAPVELPRVPSDTPVLLAQFPHGTGVHPETATNIWAVGSLPVGPSLPNGGLPLGPLPCQGGPGQSCTIKAVFPPVLPSEITSEVVNLRPVPSPGLVAGVDPDFVLPNSVYPAPNSPGVFPTSPGSQPLAPTPGCHSALGLQPRRVGNHCYYQATTSPSGVPFCPAYPGLQPQIINHDSEQLCFYEASTTLQETPTSPAVLPALPEAPESPLPVGVPLCPPMMGILPRIVGNQCFYEGTIPMGSGYPPTSPQVPETCPTMLGIVPRVVGNQCYYQGTTPVGPGNLPTSAAVIPSVPNAGDLPDGSLCPPVLGIQPKRLGDRCDYGNTLPLCPGGQEGWEAALEGRCSLGVANEIQVSEDPFEIAHFGRQNEQESANVVTPMSPTFTFSPAVPTSPPSLQNTRTPIRSGKSFSSVRPKIRPHGQASSSTRKPSFSSVTSSNRIRPILTVTRQPPRHRAFPTSTTQPLRAFTAFGSTPTPTTTLQAKNPFIAFPTKITSKVVSVQPIPPTKSQVLHHQFLVNKPILNSQPALPAPALPSLGAPIRPATVLHSSTTPSLVEAHQPQSGFVTTCRTWGPGRQCSDRPAVPSRPLVPPISSKPFQAHSKPRPLPITHVDSHGAKSPTIKPFIAFSSRGTSLMPSKPTAPSTRRVRVRPFKVLTRKPSTVRPRATVSSTREPQTISSRVISSITLSIPFWPQPTSLWDTSLLASH